MNLLNSTSDYLLQAWAYFFGTMMNFNAAYPVLAPIASLAFMVPVIYMFILNIKNQKPMREIFDIKKRIENPAWYSESIAIVVAHILLFPLYVLACLAIGAIKIYFYFVIKRIESKYR